MGMVRPVRDEEPEPPAGPGFRIAHRTYSDNATPLVEVLVMLYDWSIERQLRVRAQVPMPPDATDPL
jgi:hypothetical protein